MCGITGIACFNGKKINGGTLTRMRDSMYHRGPDDQGIYTNVPNTVALGHRRLSIIDLSSLGHQPMSNEDENIWLIHNGEVYNFPEIRSELSNIGYTFKSVSDTEVIIKAYQEWGEKSFEKLIGMFAFCIYDLRRNLLYLVRDHAGIKPLYYSISRERLIFSSEVKAFRVFNKEWEENKDWRIYFLVFGHIPEPFTTLENVEMLPKGNFMKLRLDANKYELKEYSGLKFTSEIFNLDDAIRGTREVFTNAVKRHLVSDAPIGVFLSGGIDSSLIALTASKFRKDNLRTLSVVFNEKDYSEENYQNIILRKMKSTHHSCLVTEKDFINNLDNIFEAMDQPTIDGVNTYFISKCAREMGLKSVLSGIGGDELFGGYPSFNRINSLWPVRNNLSAGFYKLFKFAKSDRFKKLSFLSIKNPIGYYLLFRGLHTPEVVARILDIDEKEVDKALCKIHLNVRENIGKKNFVSFLETNLYMQNQLLKDTDFMSMRHSVEVRVPFLDKELMRFVLSIKESLKFKNPTSKYLIMKAFEDVLPDEIFMRKKQGFTFPFELWIRKGENIFQDSVFNGHSNRKFTDKLWCRFKNRNLHWSRAWGLVVMGRFL